MSLKNELRGAAKVTLHTNFANRIIGGRMEKPGLRGIPSVFQFNAVVRIVVKSCRLDDPFAWFALGRMENALEEVEQLLKRNSKQLKRALRVYSDRIQIENTVSLKPVTHTVHVSNYGFRLLDMIALYDRVCCDCFNAIHRCRIPGSEGYQLMGLGAKAIRGAVCAADGYVYTGVTRKDLEQGNQKAREAISILVKSKFLDQTQFNGFEDICRFFAAYRPKTIYGPSVVSFQDAETGADQSEEGAG